MTRPPRTRAQRRETSAGNCRDGIPLATPAGRGPAERVATPFLGPALALLLAACSESLDTPLQGIFNQPVSLSTASSPLASTENEIPYRYPDLESANGNITRILWLSPGTGGNLVALLKDDPVWIAASPRSGPPNFIKDPNLTKSREDAWKDAAGLEPLVLTGPKEAVDAAMRLAQHVIGSIPQISIEARVVEVLETDEFAFGTQWYVINKEDQTYNPASPNAPLTPSSTIFDRSRVGRGIPNLPGTTLFVPNVLTELGTIQDGLQIDLLVSALKSFTKVDVVNAPNIAVLSGHTATITAGTEVPTFELNIVGANTVIATRFKKIGVTLDVLPALIRADTIRLAVQVKVENITGGVNVAGASSAVTATNPIIASRSATSTMDVRDGSTIILGGLISTGRTGVEDKIPVLGEIPILDFFFSNRHRQESRSNLIFFIRPKVIAANGRPGPTLIMPPEDAPALEAPPTGSGR